MVFHVMINFYPFYVASDSGLEGEGDSIVDSFLYVNRKKKLS